MAELLRDSYWNRFIHRNVISSGFPLPEIRRAAGLQGNSGGLGAFRGESSSADWMFSNDCQEIHPPQTSVQAQNVSIAAVVGNLSACWVRRKIRFRLRSYLAAVGPLVGIIGPPSAYVQVRLIIYLFDLLIRSNLDRG